MTKSRYRLLVAVTAFLVAAPCARAQRGPSPEVRATMQAIEKMLDSSSDSLVTALVQQRFAESYRAEGGVAAHVQRLKAIRAELGGMFAGVGIERDADGFLLSVTGAKEIRLRVVMDEKGMITRLEPITGSDAGPDGLTPGAESHVAVEPHS